MDNFLPIQLGEKSFRVFVLQAVLKAAGYNSANIKQNGIFDPPTATGVSLLRRDLRLDYEKEKQHAPGDGQPDKAEYFGYTEREGDKSEGISRKNGHIPASFVGISQGKWHLAEPVHLWINQRLGHIAQNASFRSCLQSPQYSFHGAIQ